MGMIWGEPGNPVIADMENRALRENLIEQIRGDQKDNLIMSFGAIDVATDPGGLAELISTEESKGMQLDPKIEEKVKAILENIVKVSAQKYIDANVSERGAVVDDASNPGIERAKLLIKAVLGEDTEHNPTELVKKASLDDLLEMVESHLPGIDLSKLDRKKVIKLVSEEADDMWSYLSDEEKKTVKTILSNNHTLEGGQDQALLVATTGVHASWDGIQGPRSALETEADRNGVVQKKLFDELIQERSNNEEIQIVDYKDLRIFRGAFRPLSVMIKEKFIEGYEEDGDIEKGIAKAIFEIMKDLVKIGSYDGEFVQE